MIYRILSMKIDQIKLREIEIQGGKSYLDAVIRQNGDLVLEGCDNGDLVKDIWGDWDYEYWITVKSDYKDTVLLHLIRERFDSETKFREWLKEKEIHCDFSSYA